MLSPISTLVRPILLCSILVAPVSEGKSKAIAASNCPFCNAISGTISDEIGESKVAVIARCSSTVPAKSAKELHLSSFRIESTMKGGEHVKEKLDWIVPTLDPVAVGDTYLLFAFNCEPLEFGGPVKLTPYAIEYLSGLTKLPEKGRDRLRYFLPYIESKEKVVADDAFNEFARASFKEVTLLRDDLDADHVRKVLRSDRTSLDLRRLFWSFLAVCGEAKDAELFHELLDRSSKEPGFSIGLEAAIACYISLKGSAGLEEIRKKYFENRKANTSDVYLAILALRAHGQEIEQIPKAELAAALRPLLDHSEIADQVIPDLARWEDWTVLNPLVKIFKDDSERMQMRIPIARYVMACPLPEAKKALEEMSQIDPTSIRQARLFMPR